MAEQIPIHPPDDEHPGSRRIALHDGVLMPIVGLGTFQGSYDCDYATVKRMVRSAIDNGYRHIDTAFVYNTEKPVGEAIREKIEERAVKRQDLFVTTKLWCTGHRRDEVVKHLRRSLQTFGLSYVDNFIIHWPVAMPPSEENFVKDESGNFVYDDTDNADTWQGMEECKRLGLTKTIGLSNFNKRQIGNILKHCKTPPTNIQVEVNPFFSNTLLVKYCKKRRITVVCFSPLGKPNRTWENSADDPFILSNPVITQIAEKHRRTPAQVVIRWLIQRGCALVPKSNDPGRQSENLHVFDFELYDGEMAAIGTCNRDFRVMKKTKFIDAPEYPFNDAY